MYARRLNSLVLVVVFHHTDTHIYLLSVALALSIHNKQKKWNILVGTPSDTAGLLLSDEERA